MNYYRMSRKLNERSTLLDQESHEDILFCSGKSLSNKFNSPLVVSLDEEFIDGDLATMYTDPAVIITKDFCRDLLNIGIDVFEIHPVEIINTEKNIKIHDYVLINILCVLSCTAMHKSEYSDLGNESYIIDKLVLDSNKLNNEKLFLVDKDTECIVINEKTYSFLKQQNYQDLYFEKLDLA